MAPAPSAVKTDRHLVLALVGAMLAVILLFSLFGPAQENDDPTPSTYNSAPSGLKAVYLLLGETGYIAERRETPEAWLSTADAPHTTAIFPEPALPLKDLPQLQAAVADFLTRGGRVLATGATGAVLLGGRTEAPSHLYKDLCFTEPEGTGAEAAAGKVSLAVPARWSANGPQYRVEQRCDTDAVVVVFRHGLGQAIWWSSPMPLTNGSLADEASLRLVRGAVGDSGRTILFDEYLRERHETILDLVHGLPWAALAWQLLGIATLLVFSFSRRHGPLRSPATEPRSSPLEFAESMGRLYRTAGATSAALNAAESRLLRRLQEQCGLPHDLLRNPAAIAEALRDRLGGDWSSLQAHLEQLRHAETSTATSPKSTLRLVQALEADERDLRQSLAHQNHRRRILEQNF